MFAELFHGLEGLPLKDRLLFTRYGQGPSVKIPNSLIHQAFEAIADTQAHAIAIEHEKQSITYGELESLANILANILISKGLQPKQRVCLLVTRSIHMVVAILAILKCGCQYIPLDGGVVAQHSLAHIIKDTQSAFILCLGKFSNRVRSLLSSDRVLVLDEIYDCGNHQCRDRPCKKVDSGDGAYVIFTSGTTGYPKGVEVSHQNLTNLLTTSPGNLGIHNGIVVSQLLSISFDMAQWEILGSLVNGGTLLIRTSEWREALSRANVIIATPSILHRLKRAQCPNVKVVALAGEPCPKPLADEWAPTCTLYNCCGPTEVTIVNTMHKHGVGGEVSIGKPIPNANVYILDDEENPVPVGSLGFMWAGGHCVSKGYVNLPDETSKKFRLDKFMRDGSYMYNTGDVARWRADGTLECRGRVDDQVKIKGFRVELNSVASSIEMIPGIIQACVIYKDNNLYGFYSALARIDEEALQTAMSYYQPYYSVPRKWIFTPLLPMTHNGKIDKGSLVAWIRNPA